MGKVEKIKEMNVDSLIPYENNAKIHEEKQVDIIARSIEEYGFINPLLIDKDFNVIAGHGRIMAAKKLGLEKVPCIFVEGLSDAQRRAYILADNRIAELAHWDYDIAFEEIESLDSLGFDIELTGFEIPRVSGEDFFERRERFDQSTEGESEEYKEFVEKFKQNTFIKTSDDCYTPDNIYNAIRDHVIEKYGLQGREIVRPFYPGGDYEKEEYKEGCVVIDNPPFSILAEIVDFYIKKNIDFFLFGPHLTIFNHNQCNVVITNSQIVYENGAIVNTAFLTNQGGCFIEVDTDLAAKIEAVNDKNRDAESKDIPKYIYPDNILTSTIAGRLVRYGVPLKIKREDCYHIRVLDEQKKEGKAIFGSGYLLSDKAAAMNKEAQEKAQEKAQENVYEWKLSERELEIVKGLGNSR